LPVINISTVAGSLESTTTSSTAQPFTFIAVAMRTGTLPPQSGIVGTNNAQAWMGGAATANAVQLNAGSTGTNTTASDNAWHALNGLVSGASSFLNVDGTETSANPSTQNFSTSKILVGYSNGEQYKGEIAEEGILAATTTSTQRGNLCHNQNIRYSLSGASC